MHLNENLHKIVCEMICACYSICVMLFLLKKILHNLNMVLIVKFSTFKMEIELHRSLICKYRKLKKSIFCDINTNESQR